MKRNQNPVIQKAHYFPLKGTILYLRLLMDILIRQARIIDPSSPFHLQQAGVFISAGIIKKIGSELPQTADTVIDQPNLLLSPGWVDIFAHFCDPGQEFNETLETGASAAAAGGFTDVFLLPNTSPVVHSKGPVEYIVQRSISLPINLHPIAAVTKAAEGKELSEMYDMHASGAVAFSDGLNSIQSPGLLLKALQYLKAIDKTIIQLPDDKSINPNGLMHEGIISTQLGLPGRPAIAEELMVARDIELLKYSDSKIHFTGVSTAKSVALIREAKTSGLQVSCSVTPYHLFFTDEDLSDYDTNLKVNPPLRTAADKKALQEAVLDGTVDCIASHHLPHHIDHKVIEFEYAKAGMIGLQTAFAVVQTAIPQLSIERLVELFATTPRKLFGLPDATITEGAVASVTLFQNNAPWTFSKDANRSRSHNSPFFDKPLTANPVGIINKGGVFLTTD
ncbi:MAG: dihydroorotase [Flaviaesturariibacter sp.]|nr:dihydroorotase [Flaviaesturariibacter sp.]